MTNEELHNQMVAAMKAKDKVRLSIIRQVMAEVKNVEVNERRDATEEDVNSMIKRLIKQTNETLEMSRKAGNNQERTDTLAEQVEILESLLPAQLSGEALVELIEQTIAEVGATTRKDMGGSREGSWQPPGVGLAPSLLRAARVQPRAPCGANALRRFPWRKRHALDEDWGDWGNALRRFPWRKRERWRKRSTSRTRAILERCRRSARSLHAK